MLRKENVNNCMHYTHNILLSLDIDYSDVNREDETQSR